MENAETVIQTNYIGTKNITKAMIPLMRTSPYGARIVSVTSRLGRLHGRKNVSNVFVLQKEIQDMTCQEYGLLFSRELQM